MSLHHYHHQDLYQSNDACQYERHKQVLHGICTTSSVVIVTENQGIGLSVRLKWREQILLTCSSTTSKSGPQQLEVNNLGQGRSRPAGQNRHIKLHVELESVPSGNHKGAAVRQGSTLYIGARPVVIEGDSVPSEAI